jgi:predicted transcriptional regulator
MRDLYEALKTLERYGLLNKLYVRARTGVAGELTKENIQKCLTKKLRRPVDDAEVAQAKAWYKEGYSVKEIAKDLDRAEGTVRRMLAD